jgi:molybdopterin converting factor small subunit
MNINVLAFGIAKEILGGAAVDVSFTDDIRVADLKAILEKQYQELKRLTSFAIAVNGAYAGPDTIIKPGDEVAIIPPVSGG